MIWEDFSLFPFWPANDTQLPVVCLFFVCVLVACLFLRLFVCLEGLKTKQAFLKIVFNVQNGNKKYLHLKLKYQISIVLRSDKQKKQRLKEYTVLINKSAFNITFLRVCLFADGYTIPNVF